MQNDLIIGRYAKFSWVITVFASIVVGLILAFWVTKLDPDGTGGGILALPAILAAFIISSFTLIFGLFTFYVPFGRRLMVFSILLWLCFFSATPLFR